jgi:hypothetical protein
MEKRNGGIKNFKYLNNSFHLLNASYEQCIMVGAITAISISPHS